MPSAYSGQTRNELHTFLVLKFSFTVPAPWLNNLLKKGMIINIPTTQTLVPRTYESLRLGLLLSHFVWMRKGITGHALSSATTGTM